MRGLISSEARWERSNLTLKEYSKKCTMFSEIQNIFQKSFEQFWKFRWISYFFVHRYYVIVHPLKSQYLCTISKAKKTVVITWILAFLLAIPIILVQVHMEVGHRIRAFWCVRNFDSPMKWQIQVKNIFSRPHFYLNSFHNKNSKFKSNFGPWKENFINQ